ncbi:MAG: hypothetical protein IKF54_00405 [Eubacterium sp.]|nr:hypothetical protein [Eubacterium sp.]
MADTVKVSYIRKDGARLDVRKQAGKRLNMFVVTQGACSDGKYIYMAFERKRSSRHKRAVRIVKLDPETMKIIGISHILKIGHANDMTYRNGTLYITHSLGRKVIHTVDTATLRRKSDIPVRTVRAVFFNGIAKKGRGYIIRNMFTSGMLETDSSFRGVRYFHADGGHKTSQCIEIKDGVIYRTYSVLQSEDKNYLVSFDLDGNVISDRKVMLRGELEGCFTHRGELWFTSYRRKVIDGRMRYLAFIGKFETEI